MAIFAFLHIWAYPWKAYDVRSQMATAESGAGYALSASEYKGGPLGLYAFLDAFNPWDIVKAIGRGFKWAVIGRRNREQDISYQPGYQNGTQLQDGAGIGKAIHKPKKGSYEPLDDESDEVYTAPYDPYNRTQPGSKPATGLGPGRMGVGSTEAFAAAPLSRPGQAPQPVQGGGVFTGHHDTDGDTGYHGAGGYGGNPGRTGLADGGELKMPGEGDFHAR